MTDSIDMTAEGRKANSRARLIGGGIGAVVGAAVGGLVGEGLTHYVAELQQASFNEKYVIDLAFALASGFAGKYVLGNAFGKVSQHR